MELNESYWSGLYTANDTTWDIGKISEPLKAYFDQLTDKSASILIPGCGNSYEAEYLLQHGFGNVTVMDISGALCVKLEEKFAPYLPADLKIICGDFLQLEGQYDLVIEQTFFCALDPALREKYVQQVHALLQPAGKLVGVLFNRDFDDGPPFGGNEATYRQLFEPKFEIAVMAPCYNSIKPRMGTELFIKLLKKGI